MLNQPKIVNLSSTSTTPEREAMKVLIQYTQAGKYRDQAWESLTLRSKGDMQAVTPSYAAQLIEQSKATLVMTEDGQIIFHS
ncbi:C factor cell-cell signaling protein [Vibrio parahaemolyticus]|nr:C factor cell-cell signaling protein [Vibrio parahaemolyticus]EGQ9712388.1 C factor cell-cell signaling protein [Vibrio parahaemolyticus]EGQ9798536.1 C factor cell-cell signaling protein [Vibrio parahaemolyticus]EGR2045750.1 C factor cell-cell signaling protein [Vibrio parahaemolyticus]EGR2228183.1 C factor cell-cell signaling protein [Vibrio parahaemolyticus]